MGDARIPEVSLAENAFDFGSVAAGGCESLKVHLENRGPIPASLHLDLSQYPDFHLERAKARAKPGGVAAGTGDDSRQGGRNERLVDRAGDHREWRQRSLVQNFTCPTHPPTHVPFQVFVVPKITVLALHKYTNISKNG